MNNKERLIELIKNRAFKKTDTPAFTLSSGKKSCYYFNLKTVTYLPEGQFLVGSLMYDRIQELNLKPKGIGGLTMGADPIAVATSLTSHMRQNAIEAFSIRKEPKPHGLGLQLEGNVRENDKIIIIDDVVTTGKSTIQAINVARKHRLDIMCVIVLLDRCEENGKENIEKHGITVYPVLTIHDFI